MDPRINAAAVALPRIDPAVQAFLEKNLPAELQCEEEEVFYEAETGDIYVAMTFLARTNDVGNHLSLVVRVPPLGRVEISSVESLLEMDLDDITHLIPKTIRQVLKNQYLNLKLKTALKTSQILNGTCETMMFEDHGTADVSLKSR